MNATPFRTLETSDAALAPEGMTFVTVKSHALHRRADVTVYVPPAAQGMSDLPIAILLHGVYGSHWAWAFKGGAHNTLARLVDTGEVPPMVLMMPSDGLWGDGSGYVPHADDDAERWIVDEVPTLARRVANGCTGRSRLLLAGLSMGGFAALRLAGKYPERFAAAAAMSAVTETSQLRDLLEESCSDWSRAPIDRSVLAALTRVPAAHLPPLRIDCGLDDPFLAANRTLHAALSEEGIVHTYAEAPGSHDWSYWSTTLVNTLRFFGTTLATAETNA